MNVYWEDEEVKTLFKFVEIKKSEGEPLIKIFNDYAQCTKRHQNSVRNYYYTEIKRLAKNNGRLQKLGINLNGHIAKEAKPFTSEETQSIVKAIDQKIKNGYSVRRACLELAGGDATKMVRFQNKYRAQQKTKTGGNMGNIIKMPIKKDYMSDEDINALFLGLIKLVKKQEISKAKFLVQDQLELANQKLRKALADIIQGQREIEHLRGQIAELKLQANLNKDKDIQTKIKKLAQVNTASSLIKEFASKKQASKSKVHVNDF